MTSRPWLQDGILRLLAGMAVSAFPLCPGSLPAEETASQSPTDAGEGFDGDPHKPEPMKPFGDSSTMTPYVVSDSVFKAYLFPSEIRLLDMFQWQQTYYDFGPFNINMRGSFVATPLRIPQHPKNSAFTAYAIDRKQIAGSPASTLDQTLDLNPDVFPSGRSDSRPSQPHDRYVALRGVGGAGPGTLVLLDGVPFNDPFDGSVNWAAAPREGLSRIEVVPGGGATAWGEGALGGVMQLFTLPPSGELVTRPGALFGGGPPDPGLTKQVVVGTGQVAATFGGLETRDLEWVGAQPTTEGALQVLGDVFSTDGFVVVSPARRGPIDTAAWNRHDWLEARWREPLGKNLVLTATIRGGGESHGDGTPDEQGRSLGRFASVAVAGHPSSGFAWNAVAYAQDEGARDTFSYVNAARTSETPAIDQFAQPASATGVSWSGEWWDPDGSSASAGFDVRRVRGETREDSAYSDGSYGSELAAGGSQGDLGAFYLRDQRLVSTLRLVIGARVDEWEEDGGHQNVSSLIGDGTFNQSFSGTNGTEVSPSLGLVWRPSENWRLHANGQESFSTPTLSELYQPYGRDAIVTEANPFLQVQHNTSFEVGAEYQVELKSLGRPLRPEHHPRRQGAPGTLTFGITAFSNDLHDAIGTLSIARNSGAVPFFGPLAGGYVAEKWINLDRARIQGVALSANWEPSAWFSFDATAILEDPRIAVVGIAPALDGKQLEGVSRRSVAAGATLHATRRFSLTTRLRVLGPQFEDDENTLRLAEAVVVDLRASYAVNSHLEVFATAENLTDSRIETGRSADGVAYLGTPRIVLGGLRVSW